MQFSRAADAYSWARTKRYQVDHPDAMPQHLMRANSAENAINAMLDIERMVARLPRHERRALRDGGAETSAILDKLETMLREGGYMN